MNKNQLQNLIFLHFYLNQTLIEEELILMITNKLIKRVVLIVIFSLYLLILVLYQNVFIYLNQWKVSIVLLLGFIVIIFVILIFFNLNHEKYYEIFIQFQFLSEFGLKNSIFNLPITWPYLLIISSLPKLSNCFFNIT
ncbi:hypothetical protein LCGC14_0965250 [marine sediment metagenome]|uniref:Uncharacterized protein n=1 Tax=marine sediment metagenome TaxID=412755 RepID=A0A0F9NDD9_9ZZZZ